MIVVDILWVYYIRRSGQGKAAGAASFATLILLCGSFVTISYTSDHRMVIPAAIGSFIGTYLAVRLDTRHPRS